MSTPSYLPGRIALILHLLLRTVSAKLAHRRALSEVVLLLHRQLHRKIDRIFALHARFVAGTLPPPRPPVMAPPATRAPRPAAPAHAAPEPPPARLPHGPWLVRLVREATNHGTQLAHLVQNDPEFPAFLAAAPEAGRLLRPIFRMLHLPLPPLLKPPPGAAHPARAAARARSKPRATPWPSRWIDPQSPAQTRCPEHLTTYGPAFRKPA